MDNKQEQTWQQPVQRPKVYSRTYKEARVAAVEKGEATGQKLREVRWVVPLAFTLVL